MFQRISKVFEESFMGATGKFQDQRHGEEDKDVIEVYGNFEGVSKNF